jgi:hypothetical protein
MRSLRTAIAATLAVALTAGCMTVQHPNAPGVQYASIAACQQQNFETPLDCEKVVHQQATSTAVKIGATILLVLSYMALVGFIIAGGR